MPHRVFWGGVVVRREIILLIILAIVVAAYTIVVRSALAVTHSTIDTALTDVIAAMATGVVASDGDDDGAAANSHECAYDC